MQAHGLGKLKAMESSDRRAAVIVISIRSVAVSGQSKGRTEVMGYVVRLSEGSGTNIWPWL